MANSEQKDRGVMKSVKKMDDGHMEQGHHRSFQLRAEKRAERDSWLEALKKAETHGPYTRNSVREMRISHSDMGSSSQHGTSNDQAGTASVSGSIRSLSATPVTSSAATPIGTPSDSGRRLSKFPSRLDRHRMFEPDLGNQMPPPVLKGWVYTAEGEVRWHINYKSVVDPSVSLLRGQRGRPQMWRKPAEPEKELGG